jgi:AGZA family xanthine/uracil permease-like MFS transporter
VGLRGWLAKSISRSLRYSFAAGIGLFLAFIGLTETGIVTAGSGVPVKLGAIRDPRVLLAIGGFIVIMALLRLRVRGAILIGIAVTAGAGILLGYGHAPRALFAMPFTGEYSLAPIALQLDIRGVLTLSFLPVLLTLFLMSFLDTLGTLVALGGPDDDMKKPMIVDALTCCLSGLLGTSTSGAYIESAAGILC